MVLTGNLVFEGVVFDPKLGTFQLTGMRFCYIILMTS